MTLKRKVAAIEASLSPTGLVLRGLTDAHARRKRVPSRLAYQPRFRQPSLIQEAAAVASFEWES